MDGGGPGGGRWAAAREVLHPADPLARALGLSTMAASLSSGLFYTVAALFLTRVAGLSATAVGLGLTVAGAAAVAGALAGGALADRVGAHRLLPAVTAGQGVALLVFAGTRGSIGFILVAAAALGLRGMQGTARAALIQHAVAPQRRVTVRAGLSVVTNLFVGLGTALAALALLLDTTAAYTLCLVLAGVLVLASALPLRGLPAGRPAAPDAAEPGGRAGRSPLRDRRFAGVCALYAVLAMHLGLQTVGVPLWISTHTDAPPATIALLMLLNTGLIAGFQVRAARGAADRRSAARGVARGGLLLGLACLLYAASAGGDPTTAVLVLVAAAAVHTAGEIWTDAGSWGLAFELADPAAAGAYQGLNQAGLALGAMLAPLVVTATAVEGGTPGWALLAALFAAAGTLTWLLAGRAAAPGPGRTRR